MYWSGETAVFVSFSQPLKDFSTFLESSKQVTLLRLREDGGRVLLVLLLPELLREWTGRLGEG